MSESGVRSIRRTESRRSLTRRSRWAPTGAGTRSDDRAAPPDEGAGVAVDRRAFLGAAALVAAGAAATGGVAALLGRSASRHARPRVGAAARAHRARSAATCRRRARVRDRQPRLLPGRHRADRAARRSRLLAAHDRRDGRLARRAVVRRAARPPARRARRHPQLRVQRGRRPLHRHRPLARRSAGSAAARGRCAAGCGPVARPLRRRHDDRHPDGRPVRRARAAALRRDERRAAAAGARLPRAHAHPRAVRLRRRLQVARRAGGDHVRRRRRVLGGSAAGRRRGR